MSTDDLMAKARADSESDEILRNIKAPGSVDRIDAALRKIKENWELLMDLRALAAKHHRVTTAPPLPPTIAASGEARADRKSDAQSLEGSIESLVQRYHTHQDSPYHKLTFKTRENYDSLIRRIVKDCGPQKLADWKARDIDGLYQRWTERGTAMAHSLITMLRGLINFGAKTLEDSECERLSVALHNMKFKMSKSRNERLTAEHANLVRAMAHKMGRPSIALAQAIQFELKLGQKDAIGEWVPLTEEGPADVVHNGKKWVRGLRWEQIGKLNLRSAQMVKEELEKLVPRPTSGPMIVCEWSGLPWTTHEFRRWWRQVADACGIPKAVKNMDSRGKKNPVSRQNETHEIPNASSGDLVMARVVRH